MVATNTAVSDDLGRALDHICGIPAGKEADAKAIQMSVGKGLPPGAPHPLGVWFGGCYYVEDENGTKGRHRRYRLVACIA